MIARMQKAMKEKDGGFTLVELIVVVVIIGVLAAIAVPVFLGQANKARIKADESALANAKIAVSGYLADGNTASPLQADLLSYGGPPTASGTLAVDSTPAWNATTGVYKLKLTGGKSGLTCTVLNDGNPTCS